MASYDSSQRMLLLCHSETLQSGTEIETSSKERLHVIINQGALLPLSEPNQFLFSLSLPAAHAHAHRGMLIVAHSQPLFPNASGPSESIFLLSWPRSQEGRRDFQYWISRHPERF